jgi:hypothetical protein
MASAPAQTCPIDLAADEARPAAPIVTRRLLPDRIIAIL